MQDKQSPIGSGFGAASTADDVIAGIDLTGKTAIVTGGYSGIGVETVRALRGAGATVIVPTRDLAKAARTLAGIDGVQVEPLDLLDPVSIDSFAHRFLATGAPLHILINSAGIMACPLERDTRGYEIQFATNHLGHFQLTRSLWPALVRANGARVIAVSSAGHRFSPVVFDDIDFEHRDYDRWSAYGQSKTANVLFAVELDKRGRSEGVRAFAVHPGGILDTSLARHISQEDLRAWGVLDENDKPIIDPSRNLKTVEMGAATSVWCATNPQLDGLGGVYCENCDISPRLTDADADGFRSGDRTRMFGVLPYAIDPIEADRLWSVSESLLGAR